VTRIFAIGRDRGSPASEGREGGGWGGGGGGGGPGGGGEGGGGGGGGGGQNREPESADRRKALSWVHSNQIQLLWRARLRVTEQGRWSTRAGQSGAGKSACWRINRGTERATGNSWRSACCSRERSNPSKVDSPPLFYL